MSAPWIKVEANLGTHPKVVAMALALDLDPDFIVGRRHRLCGYADSHTSNGILKDLTENGLDSFVNLDSFARELSRIGWIRPRASGVKDHVHPRLP